MYLNFLMICVRFVREKVFNSTQNPVYELGLAYLSILGYTCGFGYYDSRTTARIRGIILQIFPLVKQKLYAPAGRQGGTKAKKNEILDLCFLCVLVVIP